MLYDNALLLRLYVDAWRVTKEPAHRETIRELVNYVEREMVAPSCAFYATQDADSEGEEGKFFVWSVEETRAALAGDDEAATVALLHWGITQEGNFEDSGKTVLSIVKPAAELAVQLGIAPSAVDAAIARARARMFDVRERRVKPFRDEKVLASWNGLMIGALADAGAALGDAAMVQAAARAFAFVDAKLVQGTGAETRVMRHIKGAIVKGPGFLDDYAFLADAALDLFEATGEARYVMKARDLADAILARFEDVKDGGFFFTPSDGEALIHRAKDPFDHAIPSGASIAAQVLLRLGVTVDARYTDPAVRQLEALAGAAAENPFGFGQAIGVLDRLVRGSVDVVIAGDARALVEAAWRAYLPNRNVAWLRDDAAREACAELAEGKDARDAAYVCRGRTCSLPLTTPADLAAALNNT